MNATPVQASPETITEKEMNKSMDGTNLRPGGGSLNRDITVLTYTRPFGLLAICHSLPILPIYL